MKYNPVKFSKIQGNTYNKNYTMSFSHCRLETGRLHEDATGGHQGTGQTHYSLLEAQE